MLQTQIDFTIIMQPNSRLFLQNHKTKLEPSCRIRVHGAGGLVGVP